MTPKPFGYYGLNLDISTEIELDSLQLHEQTDLISTITAFLNDKHFYSNDEALEIVAHDRDDMAYKLSDIEQIGLIRGLCDRIELKLMEAAQ